MGIFRLNQIADYLTSMDLAESVLWLGLAGFAAAFVILLRTRWGESHPLGKCMLLSVLAHVLLAGYASTLQIVTSVPPVGGGTVRVSLVDESSGPASGGGNSPSATQQPWEAFVHDTVLQPETAGPGRAEPEQPREPKRLTVTKPSPLLPEVTVRDHLALGEVDLPEPQPSAPSGPLVRSAKSKEAETIEAPAAQRREPSEVVTPGVEPGGPLVSTVETPPAGTRNPVADIPAALLAEPVALPRLTDASVGADTKNAWAALIEQIPRPMRTGPAESVAQGAGSAPGSASAGSMANADSAGPSGVAANTGRLAAPSLGSLQGKYPAGEAGAGLPSGAPGASTSAEAASLGDTAGLIGPPQLPSGRGARRGTADPAEQVRPGEHPLPEAYKLRVATDRARLAERQGASPQTEEAVKAALKWLSDNQGGDGRWAAKEHGAGQELFVLGRDRRGAGADADTGVTGLALLAFLASGHTHREGIYRENVRRGLEYLLRVQAPDGNLAAQAGSFARMYCHAMAAFALSEAYGMTSDQRLRQPVLRAIGYTLAAQNPTTGGWRYAPGDPGDTSQLGWQLMALKSAELAGIPIPEKSRQGMIKYLHSVSSGRHGGLAAYRPGEPPSRSMTAEAMVCWQFLGLPREHPAGNEAGDYLLGELPGQEKGKPNLYYWYYASLAMYQLQGPYWHSWNDALQQVLVAKQRKSGPLAGSWDTDTVWGGYGGRVYTTAIATLSLEVYYRYLPLYADAAPKAD